MKELNYMLTDMWAYDLTGNEINEDDIIEAHTRNLIVRKSYVSGEIYIVGSWNEILGFLNDYIGIEIVQEYMTPLKNVI